MKCQGYEWSFEASKYSAHPLIIHMQICGMRSQYN